MRKWTIPVVLATSVAVAACGSTSEAPVYRDDDVRTPTTTALVVPLTTVPPNG